MKTKQLLVSEDVRIEYTLKKNSRAKKIILRVSPANGVVLTVPTWVRKSQYESFMQENVDWINRQVSNNIQKKESLLERNSYLENKIIAKRLVKEKVAYFNQFYNFKYNAIYIKNQITRWGSCSTLSNLNFNYRIILLPEEIQNYIIVHELCHLKEMNHSQSFWKLVEKTIPDYKILRKELRKYEKTLF